MRNPTSTLLLAIAAAIAPASPVAAADVYGDAIRADTPLAWWRFEDPSATGRAGDSSGNGIDGTYQNAVSLVANGDARGGKAAHFDGKGAHVEVAHRPKLATSALSVEFWLRTEQERVPGKHFWPGSAALVSKATSGPGSSDWTVLLSAIEKGEAMGQLLSLSGPSGPSGKGDHRLYPPAGVKLNDGAWHHVVFTRAENGSSILYIDGIPIARGNDGGGSIANERPINIGGEKWHPGGSFLHGDLDEVAIYGSVLSPARVAAHCAAGGITPRAAPKLAEDPQDPPVVYAEPEDVPEAPGHCVRTDPADRTTIDRKQGVAAQLDRSGDGIPIQASRRETSSGDPPQRLRLHEVID